MQVGLIAGNIAFLRIVYEQFNKTFGFIIEIGMIFYMFALGIEMDPYVLLKRPTRDSHVVYAGMLFTFILSCFTVPFLNYFSIHKGEFTISLSTLLSGTASPVLTRLITNLKIGKSDIGKVVIAGGMHSDFLSSLIWSLGYVVLPMHLFCAFPEEKKRVRGIITTSLALLAQCIFTASIAPWFMNWVNNENPYGKPMKGSHLVLSIAFMVLICAISPMYEYSPILSAFMTGICLPREGRLSKWFITKINYLLTTIFFPIFFLWMGYAADFSRFEADHVGTWARLFLLIFIVIAGKVIGIVVSGAILGLNWHEAAAIGLLFSIKGHFHIYLAIKVVGNSTIIYGL